MSALVTIFKLYARTGLTSTTNDSVSASLFVRYTVLFDHLDQIKRVMVAKPDGTVNGNASGSH
jgi:hypothetical protein